MLGLATGVLDANKAKRSTTKKATPLLIDRSRTKLEVPTMENWAITPISGRPRMAVILDGFFDKAICKAGSHVDV